MSIEKEDKTSDLSAKTILVHTGVASAIGAISGSLFGVYVVFPIRKWVSVWEDSTNAIEFIWKGVVNVATTAILGNGLIIKCLLTPIVKVSFLQLPINETVFISSVAASCSVGIRLGVMFSSMMILRKQFKHWQCRSRLQFFAKRFTISALSIISSIVLGSFSENFVLPALFSTFSSCEVTFHDHTSTMVTAVSSYSPTVKSTIIRPPWMINIL